MNFLKLKFKILSFYLKSKSSQHKFCIQKYILINLYFIVQ